MFHIFPNIFGGYDIYLSDSLDNFAGVAGALLVIFLLIVMLVEAVVIDLAVFAAAVAMLLLCILILFCSSGKGTFSFLAAIAPYLFYYALMSICFGIYENAGKMGTLGVFAVLGIVFVFALGALILFFIICIAIECCLVGARIIVAIYISAAPVGLWFSFAVSNSWIYVFRIISIMTVIWLAISLIAWLKKTKFDGVFLRSLLSNLIYFALGFLPIIIIAVAGNFEYTTAYAAFLFGVVFVIYAAIAAVILKLYKAKGDTFDGNMQFVLAPYLIMNIALLAGQAVNNVPSEAMSVILPALQSGPLSAQLALVAAKSNAMFAGVLTPILNGIVSLFLRIFDTSVPYFSLPPAIGSIVGMAAIIFAVSLGATIYFKMSKRLATNASNQSPVQAKPAATTKPVASSPTAKVSANVAPQIPLQEQTGAQKPRAVIGRYDPCPCGSGKKYKDCCMASSPPPKPSASGLTLAEAIRKSVEDLDKKALQEKGETKK